MIYLVDGVSTLTIIIIFILFIAETYEDYKQTKNVWYIIILIPLGLGVLNALYTIIKYLFF